MKKSLFYLAIGLLTIGYAQTSNAQQRELSADEKATLERRADEKAVQEKKAIEKAELERKEIQKTQQATPIVLTDAQIGKNENMYKDMSNKMTHVTNSGVSDAEKEKQLNEIHTFYYTDMFNGLDANQQTAWKEYFGANSKESVEVPLPDRDVDKPFLMPIEDVFSLIKQGDKKGATIQKIEPIKKK